MNRRLHSIGVACALSAVVAIAAIAQTSAARVSVSPRVAGIDIAVLTAGMNEGKGRNVATTDQDGQASFDPLAFAATGTKFQVITEQCADGNRVVFVQDELASNYLDQKDGCRRRRAGALLVGTDTSVSVKFGGGSNIGRNLGIAGGIGGGIIGVIAGAGGSNGSSPSSPSSPPSSSTPPSSSSSGTPPASPTTFCGNFQVAVNPTAVGCGFSTAFSDGQLSLTCSADGSAQARIFRPGVSGAQEFNYTGRVGADGSLNFSGSGNLRGLATYNGTLTGTVSREGRVTATNRVVFTEPSCNGQVLVQDVSGQRLQ